MRLPPERLPNEKDINHPTMKYKVTAHCNLFEVNQSGLSTKKVKQVLYLIRKMKRFYCSTKHLRTRNGTHYWESRLDQNLCNRLPLSITIERIS